MDRPPADAAGPRERPLRPLLPESLASFGGEVRGARLASADPLESAIVTAFFDIGRDQWREDGDKPSRLRRSVDLYLQRFGWLAALKNPMVVFVESHLADRVLEARREQGLEGRTAVVVIDRLFEREPIAALAAHIQHRLTPRYREWVLHPEAPEYREPRYVLVNAALDLGLVEAAQIAWIDFGYCGDDQRFDPAKPWRFDAGDRINLFHMAELDEAPITRVVRRGDVYFQGCHIVGPAPAWRPFAREIGSALEALLACDLVDDDQTMMLMAWRRDPARYRIHGVMPPDWRVLFRRFNADTPLEPVRPPPAAKLRSEPPLHEELRIHLKRWEWRLKAWRRSLGLG